MPVQPVRGSTSSLPINYMGCVNTARAIWRGTDGGLPPGFNGLTVER
jgi:hypothetical protein